MSHPRRPAMTFDPTRDGHPIDVAWEQLDLFDIPEPSKAPERVWVNVYPSSVLAGAHASRAEADRHAHPGRLECVEYVRART